MPVIVYNIDEHNATSLFPSWNFVIGQFIPLKNELIVLFWLWCDNVVRYGQFKCSDYLLLI